MKDKESKKNNLFKAVGISFIILDIILVVILIGLVVDSSMEEKFDFVNSNSIPDLKVDSFDDPVLGNLDAPITIIEYSDFECPFCVRFYNGAYQDIFEDYVVSGDVKIIYKDFPLMNIHKNAMVAAQAVQCANEQGKAFELHDRIFEEGNPTVTNLKVWAIELGFDSEVFDACLDSGKYESEVLADLQEGQEAGVTGTPTVFINGKKIVGAQPFSVFKQAIDEELQSLE